MVVFVVLKNILLVCLLQFFQGFLVEIQVSDVVWEPPSVVAPNSDTWYFSAICYLQSNNATVCYEFDLLLEWH
jgi:hypothetical protein